jgi:hypothetical protein
MKITGLHIIIAVAVLAAIGEFTSGYIRKGAWIVLTLVAAIHTFQTLGE